MKLLLVAVGDPCAVKRLAQGSAIQVRLLIEQDRYLGLRDAQADQGLYPGGNTSGLYALVLHAQNLDMPAIAGQ